MARTINLQEIITNSGSSNVCASDYMPDWIDTKSRSMIDWNIYYMAQELRTEMEELRLIHGDAVYAAVKEAGFEDKVIAVMRKTIAKKHEDFEKLLKETLASFEKEKEQIKKEFDELKKQIQDNTASLRLIDTIAKELGYQTKIANKSF